MTWQTHQLLAMTNLVLCLGIAWACICRLNNPICKRYRLARLRYSVLLAGALSFGLEPLLFGSWPSVGGVLLAVAVLADRSINVVRWYAHEKKETP